MKRFEFIESQTDVFFIRGEKDSSMGFLCYDSENNRWVWEFRGDKLSLDNLQEIVNKLRDLEE